MSKKQETTTEKENKTTKKKKQSSKASKTMSTVLLVIIFVFGLGLLLYPTISDYYNSFHQTRSIASYTQAVAKMDDVDYQKYIDEANEFNRRLYESGSSLSLSNEQKSEYYRLLDVTGNGIMGYIEIPKIKVSLPIYHGTSEAVLQVAIGHIEGTSLPVGGVNTHCVLSGHRGLPSAKLFTNLDQMSVGDEFIIRTLDEIMTYEVDQILIVLPDQVDALQIQDGKDLCTLVTCTPYGINTHRMLVRGHRVDNKAEANKIRVTADLIQTDQYMVALVLSIPLLILALIILFIDSTRRKKIQQILNEKKKEMELLTNDNPIEEKENSTDKKSKKNKKVKRKKLKGGGENQKK